MTRPSLSATTTITCLLIAAAIVTPRATTAADVPLSSIFSDPITIALPHEPENVLFADLDNDGDMDMVNNSPEMRVYINNDGTFIYSIRDPTVAYSLAVADIDLDGDLDLFKGEDFAVYMFLNQGGIQGGTGGFFGAPITIPFPSIAASGSLVIGPWTKGNDPWVVYGDKIVYRNSVNSNPPTFSTQHDWRSFSSAFDYSKDGVLDIASVITGSINTVCIPGLGCGTTRVAGFISIWETGPSNPITLYLDPVNITTGFPGHTFLDVNGDNTYELLVNKEGHEGWLYTNLTGPYVNWQSTLMEGSSIFGADIDLDGDDDVVTDVVSILFSDNGILQAPVRLVTNSGDGVRVVDYDFDGDSDIILLSQNSAQMRVYLNKLVENPILHVIPEEIVAQVTEGGTPPSVPLTVRALGATISYSISDNADWLGVTPQGGVSSGETDNFTINFNTAALNEGVYNAIITISDNASAAITRTIPVQVTVGTPDQPSKLLTYNFGDSTEGWFYQGVGHFTGVNSVRQNGDLVLTLNNNNTNSYGFWVGPLFAIQMEPFDPMTDPSQSGPLAQRTGPHYMVRYHVRRTTPNAAIAPELRLRVNSSTFEDYHTVLMPTTGGNVQDVAGLNSPTIYNLLFLPHPYMYTLPQSDRWYYLSFDLWSFDADHDPNGGFILEKVDVFRIPKSNIVPASPVKNYTFGTGEVQDWAFYDVPALYEAPQPSFGDGWLALAAPGDGTHVYGTWQNLPGTIPANVTGVNGKLFVRMKTHVRTDIVDGRKSPHIRARVMPSNFTTVSTTGFIDIGTFSFVPASGNDRVMYTYLEVPSYVTSAWDLHAAFDLFSEELFANDTERALYADSNLPVYLETLEIDLVRILDFPAAN